MDTEFSSRRTFLAWLARAGAVAAASAAAPAWAASPATHMTLQELASRYGFRITTLGSKSSNMSGRTGSLSFVHKTQQARINSTTAWLCSPVVPYHDRWGVSLTDVYRVLDPILRPRSSLRSLGARVVVLDSGHGDGDVGTLGTRYKLREKDLTLDMAKRVRTKLVNAGYKTLLTRDTDRFIDLDARPARARTLKADVFISLHFNSGNRTASGIETFVMTPRGKASTGSTRVSTNDYAGNRNDGANHFLGYCLQKRTRTAVDAVDRGIRHARFAVLRGASCPAALVECGFLSHARTEEQLRSLAYRDRIAQGISDGVADYLREVAAANAVKPAR